MTDDYSIQTPEQLSPVGRLMRFCMTNMLVVTLLVLFTIAAGIYFAPFDWKIAGVDRDPVATDAIPDIGENQQIVFTDWSGRSPRDVEDQITTPLTRALQGIANVRTIRGISDFGFSSVYIIFTDKADFYGSRSRVLEKLSSLPDDTLPEGVRPALGPDATALGQIFWYTLEGRDPNGNPAGGWDLEELRTIQDWTVRYGLYAEGVSEVASVGGFVREYQVDLDPDAMRAYDVTLDEVLASVRGSNVDVGAKVLELNRAEYLIRGVGFIKGVSDIENSVIKVNAGVPVLVRHVARVVLGPELRRGALDKTGAEAVGGVVVARFGSNPLAVIQKVKDRARQMAPGLPEKAVIDMGRVSPQELLDFAQRNGFAAYNGAALNQEGWLDFLRAAPRRHWPAWATISKVAIVPFYDRAGLIHETLGTLNEALFQEMLLTVIVIIIMVMHLRSSMLISMVMPLAVGMTFIAMKVGGVDANIVSLSGIAIAIGTIVDMGIVICENILRHLEQAPPEVNRLEVVHRAAAEVGSAVVSASASTVISFLPIFFMSGQEGKLFRPLAFTKTFALVSSIVVAITVIPPLAHILFTGRISKHWLRGILYGGVVAAGILAGAMLSWWVGLALILVGLCCLVAPFLPPLVKRLSPWLVNGVAVILVGILLTTDWEPLGPQRGLGRNLIFVFGLIAVLMGSILLFQKAYPYILRFCLRHKALFMSLPVAVIIMGVCIWLGFGRVFGVFPAVAVRAGADPNRVYTANLWVWGYHTFPGLGKEFMPPLDEGSFLFMPTMMPHASIGEALEVLSLQDQAVAAIPEVESVVGKIGRADTALDPAPVSMIETVISYKSQYKTDKDGRRVNYRYDSSLPGGRRDKFVRDANGELIEDPGGQPFRQWRDEVRTVDDIWQRIVQAAQLEGITSAPKLQPIAARLVMLQSGMRAPMGVKVYGSDLKTIEEFGYRIERLLKEVPSIEPATVIADRVVGKPYLEIEPDRQALARYGVKVRDFQDVVEYAIGGERVITTIEGRERFPVRVRYSRELRDSIEAMSQVLVPTFGGEPGREDGQAGEAPGPGAAMDRRRPQIPLGQLATIRYVRGPQMIRSEDTFPTSYVLFDKKAGTPEVDVVEQADRYLKSKEQSGELVRPPGVFYKFAGTYENQQHAQQALMIMVPLSLFLIFLVLYFQFRSITNAMIVFFGVAVAWSGGFLIIWLYAQDWFLDFWVLGVNMRELFQIRPINMSVAVWVGFLALFGIADDDGVVMGTCLDQTFRDRRPSTVGEIRQAVEVAGRRRIRACLMTTATTILALIPVLTSTGRGSDVMVPMAIPSFGGMTIELLTMLTVPVLYCFVKEIKLRNGMRDELLAAGGSVSPPPAGSQE
jgi:Cu(I)/Ag(I) efflux system membrane protein CusA/SilA